MQVWRPRHDPSHTAPGGMVAMLEPEIE